MVNKKTTHLNRRKDGEGRKKATRGEKKRMRQKGINKINNLYVKQEWRGPTAQRRDGVTRMDDNHGDADQE